MAGAASAGGEVEGAAPQASLSLVEAYWGKDQVFIPRSAYVDLGNPRAASIETVGRRFRLVISGGDAATSYTAMLLFEGGMIRNRKVVNSEFPDSAWEETVYSFTLKSE